MTQRSITIYVPPQDYPFFKAALETLAGDIITDQEAGQRGTKLSKMILMIATAYIGNCDETTRLMKEIKNLTTFESRYDSQPVEARQGEKNGMES